MFEVLTQKQYLLHLHIDPWLIHYWRFMNINLQLSNFMGRSLLPWGISVLLPISLNICRYSCFNFLT